MLVQVYGDNAMKKTAGYKWEKRTDFQRIVLYENVIFCSSLQAFNFHS